MPGDNSNRTEPTESAYRKMAYAIPILTVLVARILLPRMILDDGYITLQMAKNLSRGHGLVFNAGERIYAITTPVWGF